MVTAPAGVIPERTEPVEGIWVFVGRLPADEPPVEGRLIPWRCDQLILPLFRAPGVSSW
jgi:hypothetical protein